MRPRDINEDKQKNHEQFDIKETDLVILKDYHYFSVFHSGLVPCACCDNR